MRKRPRGRSDRNQVKGKINGQEASGGGWCESLSQREGEKEEERRRERELGKDGGGLLWLFCHICNLCLMLPGSPGNFLMWRGAAWNYYYYYYWI